jgi:cysteinyl-tRNA synthetase
MGLKYLGSQFDIHGGARDLIFPHHENEIAQSEAMTGKKPFVKYWLHTGFLKINGEKMAKSLGNYITVREALKKYSAEAIRLFVLSTHYRSEIDFTDERLKGAESSLRRLYNTLESLEDTKKASAKREPNDVEHKFGENVEKLRGEFVKAMDEDFNTPQALAALFELSKEINRFLDEQKQVNAEILEKVYDSFSELGKALGLFQQEKTKDVGGKIVDDLVQLLFDLREELRKKGDYGLSDEIRARMKELGLVIEDTAEGPKWKLA